MWECANEITTVTLLLVFHYRCPSFLSNQVQLHFRDSRFLSNQVKLHFRYSVFLSNTDKKRPETSTLMGTNFRSVFICTFAHLQISTFPALSFLWFE